MQTFRYDRGLSLLVGTALLLALPMMSLFELFSNGSIDFSAVSPTRFEVPIWILYLIGWSSLVTVLPCGLFDSWRYALRGYVFRISEDKICLDGVILNREEITSTSRTFRGVKVQTEQRTFYFHPYMSLDGEEAFEAFLTEFLVLSE